ncbi:Glyoxylate/hydroxypyruvate reductase B [Seminavis robusta]|uniref:Glyoxylate/hydroxypyruvate reductase B n=1 Tax=Seminavis robusta TaxID=568900 RepID=A0A9N8E2V0_9STRA|nr:Glyoxylate/hydroxypyruvate reductase B [Seminavis robusta]|eukprot:Sro470_g149530.1 Glyoxylate/hydroxypyruvate reductase B (368) ;mRNA; r:32322-33527
MMVSSKVSLIATSTARRLFSSMSAAMEGRRPVALFLNASRLDYDNKLDFSRIQALCDFQRHDTDIVKDLDEMVSLVEKHQAEIVITKEMPVPEEAFRRFPDSVKLLCEAGTGYNNLPIQAARERNVPVCNCPTYSTDAVAHMAITYLMNFSVSMFDQQRMLWEDNRANFTGPFTLPLSEINGKTLGLVGGAGKIGTKVAQVGLALGMNVIISSRKPTLPEGHALSDNPRVTVCTSENVGTLLSQSDYVSLHTPLNDQTRGTFGRAQISQMKQSAFLINTSRGAVCNEEELIGCMKEKMIAGAGLDVTTTEPPPMDSELWNLPNVFLSPHTGWRRIETRQRLVTMTAENIEAYCQANNKEEAMINIVN